MLRRAAIEARAMENYAWRDLENGARAGKTILGATLGTCYFVQELGREMFTSSPAWGICRFVARWLQLLDTWTAYAYPLLHLDENGMFSTGHLLGVSYTRKAS